MEIDSPPEGIAPRPFGIYTEKKLIETGRDLNAGIYKRTCLLHRNGGIFIIIKYFMQVYNRCAVKKTDPGSGKYVRHREQAFKAMQAEVPELL